MALLNIFKKQKPKEAQKRKRKEEKGGEKMEPKSGSPEIIVAKPKKEITGLASKVLKSVHITEKATNLTNINQYVFKVFPHANKIEIKKAIEELYGVEVEKVNVIHVPARRRRLGRSEGWKEGLKKGYKKAIVKLKKGQKIEVLPR